MIATVVEPTQACRCCKRPNTVYDPKDLCNRCQRRVAHAMGRISMIDKERAGYRRLVDRQGNFCGYMKTNRVWSEA